MVVWVTGLAGAGKTTFALRLKNILLERLTGVIHLDGDFLRKMLGQESPNSYLRWHRLELAHIYAQLARTLSEQKSIVIISTISLFKEVHSWNRMNIKNYMEVLICPSTNVLMKRDQKQLYSEYESGLTGNIAGLDLNIEFPSNPEFKFNEFGRLELEDVAQEILKKIDWRGL